MLYYLTDFVQKCCVDSAGIIACKVHEGSCGICSNCMSMTKYVIIDVNIWKIDWR